MSRLRRIAILGLLAAIAPAFGQLYTDSPSGSGDLPGDQTVRTFVGTLSQGMNIVQGTHVFNDGGTQGDTFTVALPPGLLLVSNTLVITNANMDGPGGTTVQARFYNIPSPVFDLETFSGNTTLDLSPVANFTNGPQELSYSVQFQTVNGTIPNPSYNWVWQIQTAPVQPFSCFQNAGVPPQIRSNGERELVGDVVVTCSGGTPTGAGQVVPLQSVSLFLNTEVTSQHLMSPFNEALVLVDEPVTPATNQLVCETTACDILGTGNGTGTGTYNGTPGRPNVFVGELDEPNQLIWTLPVDPPGSGTRVFRFVNLRANGASLGAGANVVALTTGFPTNNPTSVVAFVANPFAGIQVTDAQSIGGALSSFKLRLPEGFATVFKTRTTAGPGPADQNTPGSVSSVESGFHNSAFPVTVHGDVGQAGLADSGTRVMVRLEDLANGVTVTVPTTISVGALVARLVDTGDEGAGNYSPSASGLIIPYSEGFAQFVYEFTQTSPLSLETLEIPVALNYGIGARLMQQVNGEVGLVPIEGEGIWVPQFEQDSFFQFQANVPPAPLSLITTTLPNGTIGTFYSQPVQAAGGVPPYDFNLAVVGSNISPPGLTMQSNGLFSGTPTQSGTFNFDVVVADYVLGTASRSFQVQIAEPVEITTGSPLPPGAVGSPYATTFAAIGGTQPYRFFFSGNPPPGFSLSQAGVLSGVPSISGTFNFAVQALDASNRSAIKAFTVTVAPQSSVFQLSALQLEFTGPEGGKAPPVQSLTIQTQLQQSVNFSITIDGGSPNLPAPGWLKVVISSTGAPYRMEVGADQGSMPAGTYNARILVGVAGNTGQPSLIVPVTLRVVALPQKLSVFPNVLKFVRQTTLPGLVSKTVRVLNTGGGGPIAFTASVVGNSPWIKAISPAQGQAGTNNPAGVRVDVDSTGLPAGFHRGIIRFTWSGGTVDLPVVLFVAPAGAYMQLNRTGVYFRSNAGVFSLQTEQVKIRNLDPSSVISWTATIVRGDEWLAIAPTSGTATFSWPGEVTLGVKPAAANLPPGPAYALVRIDAPNTTNAPQYIVAVLDIQGGTTTSGLDFDGTGVVLVAPTGSTKVLSHTFKVTAGSRRTVFFNASAATIGGGNIFYVDPLNTAVSSLFSSQITVFAYPNGLGQGVYRGEVAVSTASRVETLAVTLIVTDSVGGESLPSGARAAGCVPSFLAATQVGLTNSFSVPAGWPTALAVDLRDSCGNLVLNGSVVADFSNGDPPLSLTGDGVSSLYSATWQPVAQVNPMTITIHAQTPDLPQADLPLTGGVVPNPVPALYQNGAVHNLDPKLGGPLSPGVIAQVYGTNLASVTESTGAPPLATLYKGTQMLIGPYEAPLYFVSPGQLNVQVPTELAPNLPYAVVVSVNGALTVPDTISVVPVVPGVAAFQDGRIIAQHNADFALVTDANPAKRNEFLILYLAGLGATNPPVASGQPSPAAEPFGRPVAPVTVTLGGQQVEVPFAGLTPFAVGLFQINFKVPADAPLNTPLDIVITQGGLSANVATLTVAP